MQVFNNLNSTVLQSPREVTKESMQQDFDYEMAKILTKALLDNGLINENEFMEITRLNKKNFTPFYTDIMDY